MRKLFAAVLLCTPFFCVGCGTVAKTEASWDHWRAESNQKAGNLGTAQDYRRKEQINRAEAAQHRF